MDLYSSWLYFTTRVDGVMWGECCRNIASPTVVICGCPEWFICICLTTEYLNYRECLERAKSSPLFVRCTHLVTKSYSVVYNVARTLTAADVANTLCQWVWHDTNWSRLTLNGSLSRLIGRHFYKHQFIVSDPYACRGYISRLTHWRPLIRCNLVRVYFWTY